MIKKYLLALFLICFALQTNSALSSNSKPTLVSMMPNATISVDVTTICQYSDSPIITLTGSAGTAPYTFTYTRNGVQATVTTAPGENSVTLTTATNFDGVITYVLTNVQDQTGASMMVTGQSIDITITPGPDPTINGDGTEPGQFLFSICDGNPTATFTFTNASSTASTLNTNYTIDWGDGTTPFTGTTWNLLTHDYNQGTYTLTYTIVGNNGCTTVQEYTVFLGSTPGIGFDTPGNTTICAGGSLTFQITGFENNPASTTYTVVFSDGTTLPTITHPPPSSITHQFNVTSCGTNSGGFMNSFSATISASNLCATSTATVAPILVSSDPIADFSFPTEPACTNTEVCFQDLSIGNATNGTNSDCDTNPSITWQITPNTYTINSGTLGNDFGSTNPNLWITGSENLCVNFTQPGNYTITQMVGNTCATDMISQTICVEAPVNPQFTLSTDNGCTPLAVTTTNTTDESSGCVPPTYLWQVTYASDFCGTTPEDWSFTNGTSATSANPSFNFVTPGTYTIQLAGTNFCGTENTSQQVIVKQPPTATIDPVGIICNTTSINPSAIINTCTDNAGSVTYDWQFPGATPASSNLESPGTIDYGTAGTYTFTLQVTNDCGTSALISETFTIEEVPVITNTNLTQDICSGTAFSDINVTSSVTGTTFSWTATATAGISGFSPSGTGDILGQILTTTNTASGTVTYTVTPTIGNCDGTPVDFVITVNPAPEITQQPQSSVVCQNGAPITLSVATSDASAQYQWFSNTTNSNTGGTAIAGATNADYIPPTDTIGELFYYCEITFATGGCSNISSQVASVTVTPNASITNQPTTTQSLCVGSTIDTPLSVTFTDGTGTVSYQWFSNTTNSNTGGTAIAGATNATYTPPIFTTAGNFYYYVELSFAGSGCNDVISDVAEIIVVNSPVVDVQPLATQTLCQNSVPQDVTVQASGGLGTFSYQWFSNTVNSNTGGTAIAGATNATFTPPTNTVGTLYYYCVISQAASASCSAVSNTSEVNVNPGPAFTTQPPSQELCLGDAVTTLSVSFTNGVGTPTYQWYSNTVDDVTTGTAIAGETTASYTPSVATTGTIYYYCIITFSTGGCSEITSNTAEIIVNETPSISNFTETICSGDTFSITPNTTNGDTVPTSTTYTWTAPTIVPVGSITGASAATNPQTNISQTLTNSTASPAVVTYTVTPTAGICNGTPFTVEVTVNPAISANITITQIDCFGANNGEIITNITGGVPFTSGTPYILSWTGPGGFTSSNATISNLAPGDYTLSVQDEGGCPFNETYTITEPNALTLTVDTENSISCFGANDGEIAVTIAGGTPNYVYNWTRNGIAFSTNEDISNLSAATYELTVTDANGCGPVTQTFVITEPNELLASLVNQTNVACFGETSGAIDINVTGGSPTETAPGVFEYTYAWTGPNGFTSTDQNLTNLAGGTYNLTVTDANGCDDTLSVLITQPDEIVITFTSTEPLCFDDNNGSITITSITGGSGSYTIAWSNLGEGLSQTNLSAGDYTITVTDTNNCTASVTVTIPPPISFTIAPVVQQISCFGANDGSINLNFQGGQEPIDFAWTDDANAGTERNNLGPGAYTVNITDATPCSYTETFIIIQPAELTLSGNITNALDCDDASSGAINLLISGGSEPYTVSWSNGETSEDLNDIPAGDYLVNVVDGNGCEASDTFTIIRPPEIVIDVATETVVNCAAFSASQIFTAQVSGGVPPFSLNWSSGIVTGVNDEMMTTSQNGLVILDVTDALGCTASYTFEVDIPEFSDADFTLTSVAFETFGIYSQIDPIQFTTTTTGDDFSVSWDFGDGNFSNEENPIHSYASPGTYIVTQTVTFPDGCVYTKVISLEIDKGYKLELPTGFTPNEDGLNDLFRPIFIGLDSMELNIYDTWGSLIYSESGDTIRGWDGTVGSRKPEKSENGNYYYTFTAKTFFGKTVEKSGAFTLIL
ncbi:PKD domain-containing protein [Kordia sp. SMS9]|uniref:PKD domain-containing protein n=1 Tax=Kordia sp. SMS9 TaxID=2282170 RepID=UPI0013B37A9A|nr:PKD domain-containing protein [Kordia sp. SMS9]